MESQWRGFPDGFLIRLSEAARVTVNDIPDIPIQGELILARPPLPEPDEENPDNPPEIVANRYELLRAAFMLSDVAVEAGNTGIVSLVGTSASIIPEITENEDGLAIASMEIPLRFFVAVEAIEGGYRNADGDVLEPSQLVFQGNLFLRFVRENDINEEFTHINNWRIEGADFSAERMFEYPERETFVHRMGGVWGGGVQLLSLDMNILYPPSTVSGSQREIRVRPIWIQEAAPDQATRDAVEPFIRTQMLETQEIWSRANVNVIINWGNAAGQTAFEIIAGVLARGESAPTVAFASRRDWLLAVRSFARNSAAAATIRPEAGMIDIYFTDWFNSPIVEGGVRLPNAGGALTNGSNTAIGCILTTSRRLPSRGDASPAPFAAGRRWMDYLVAHEFGHILGLKHPDDSDTISDGNLSFPVITPKAFRWDPPGDPDPLLNDCSGTAPNDPNDELRITRMCSIISLFDNFWTAPIGGNPPREPGYNWTSSGNIMVDIAQKPVPAISFPRTNLADYSQRFQTMLDTFAAQLTAGDVPAPSLNPVFILFIADTDANALIYDVGFAIVGAPANRYIAPIYVFNKEQGNWANRFDETNFTASFVAFREAIYRHIKQPTMHVPGFGTIMDVQTPDPAVVDLDICQAVSQGVRFGGLAANKYQVSSNPAARYLATTTNYRPNTRFGMYIPSKKGDVGRLSRSEFHNVYFSPYVWNSSTLLDPATMLRDFRTLFYEPSHAQPSHDWPVAADPNHLYVHVRMRANYRPAVSTLAVADYANYLDSQTLVFVAVRPAGGGAGTYEMLGSSWGMSLVERINTTNDGIPTGQDLDPTPNLVTQRQNSHPFVAGLTYHQLWDALGLPGHSCIFALVINPNEPILNPANPTGTPLLRFTDINAGWNFATWLDNRTNAEFAYLIDQDLQFVQRNVDIQPLPPSFASIKMLMPPMAAGTGLDGDGFEPIYEINTLGLDENARLFIETFNGEVQELALVDGKVQFDAAGTTLRPGIYGMSLSLQLAPEAVIEEAIVIEYRTRVGENLLDGFRFEIQNGRDEEFTAKLINAAKAALRDFYNQFASEIAADFLQELNGINANSMDELLAWLRDSSHLSFLTGMRTAIEENAAEDMPIVSVLDSLLGDLDTQAEDGVILQGFKGFVDRLHFLVLLHNGMLAGEARGSAASVREDKPDTPLRESGDKPPSPVKPEQEETGLVAILMAIWNAIKKLLGI